MTALRAAGITDPGQVRAQNQDAFYVAEDLVLIADGMGGYAGGEVAAAIAAEVVGARFLEDGSANGLEAAVAAANRQIFERGVEPGLEGMGTTLVAAAVVGSGPTVRVLVANVGDSRAYLLRDGTLRQLTEDHSVAAELVRLGRLEEDEGQEHPGRHVLTRALGVDRDVAPDLIEVEPQPGDRLLLCSDGLSNELDDDQILALLGVGEPSDAARSLVAAANAHGGLDNVTAVVADVDLDDDAVEGTGGPAAAAAGDGAVATGSEAASGAAPAASTSATSAATSTVRAVASTETGAAATRLVTAVPASPSVAVRPVLTARERRRRRREDRRARRAYNKWVSFRGALFLLAVVAVLVGGYVVLRWYGTSNYVVAIHGRRVVILQGQPGGFLWWPQKVVVAYHFGLHQVPQSEWPAFRSGQQESTLKDAMHFVANWHLQWQRMTGNLPTTTTTTSSTTTTLLSTTGGT
ncbi:MAG TPA: PP2C family serine/threonine-protein phosphatase [Acidimicrobiales bacterium]|nr:PP2C family serine/threonine-protein phosphatase [Acidimicrobiales bacterium]